MAKSMNYKNLEKNLPDAFYKGSDGNNYKILQICRKGHEGIEEAARGVFDCFNIANAEGQVLDDIYGARANLARGELDDAQYIIRLKGKMMQNTVDGSFGGLVAALAFVLSCDESEILLQENGDGTVSILNIPLGVLTAAGFGSDEIVELIEAMLPVSVKVSEYGFSGTFEFSDAIDEYDEDAGFADDDSTIGGYLGLFAG